MEAPRAKLPPGLVRGASTMIAGQARRPTEPTGAIRSGQRTSHPVLGPHASFYPRPMRRGLAIGVGVLLALMGVVWTLQGLGYVGGSVMSGVTFWAVVGPLVALAGLLLAVVGGRRR